MSTTGRALRGDAERTVRTILVAAERVLSADPTATMEQIAEAAGVARTTVHRRFATREALVEALTAWAAERFAAAVNAVNTDTAPPLVALYQITANVLEVKISWGYAMDRAAASPDPAVARIHTDAMEECDRLFRRAQQQGVVRPDVDPEWARRVYYALICEVSTAGGVNGEDAGTLAALVVDTLLHGIAPRPA